MHQIKLFTGLESSPDELEGRINSWLSESNARVIQMFGNIAPQTVKDPTAGLGGAYGASDLFIAVIYEPA